MLDNGDTPFIVYPRGGSHAWIGLNTRFGLTRVVVCGLVLVVCCVVLFWSCVCVCDLFLFLHESATPNIAIYWAVV